MKLTNFTCRKSRLASDIQQLFPQVGYSLSSQVRIKVWISMEDPIFTSSMIKKHGADEELHWKILKYFLMNHKESKMGYFHIEFLKTGRLGQKGRPRNQRKRMFLCLKRRLKLFGFQFRNTIAFLLVVIICFFTVRRNCSIYMARYY